MLPELLDYVIEYHYNDIWKKYSVAKERYLAFYEELVRRTAYMVAQWQCVGCQLLKICICTDLLAQFVMEC